MEKLFKVYIIESPGDMDLLIGRREGTSLSEIFILEQIKHEYYLVVSRKMLIEAINLIRNDIIALKEQEISVFPIVHLSCHGNNDCISTSNGTMVRWSYFNKIIGKINDVFYDGEKNNILLCMSSCCGLSAINADKDEDDLENKSPFARVIGSENEVGWADSLIAFSVFYHNYIINQKSIKQAVTCMNASIDEENYFQMRRTIDNRFRPRLRKVN